MNSSCDTNKWLIIDFVSPKRHDFLLKMHYKALPVGLTALVRHLGFRDGALDGVEREGKGVRGKGREDTLFLQTDRASN